VNTFNVAELPEGYYFTEDAYLDKKFLILPPNVPIADSTKKALRDWDFFKIYSEGHPSEQPITNDAPKPSMTDATAEFEAQTEIEENPLANAEPQTEEGRIAQVERIFLDYQGYISEIFTRYATKKELPLQAISDKVKDLCEFVKEYKRYILRIQPSQENRNKNYLVVHSMRSTVFAIVIAIQLKFPIHKQIELGVACILHEIGMIRLPPQLYMGNRTLTPIEKNAIFTHPVISYNILREFSFPLNICLGVLEHHERENGEGYPRKLTKEKISIYGKIIAVACSYEAITSPRPYKEARDAYTGIIDIMKNQGKQYDETIIRALLFSVSLYPIGLFVLLSNDKVGQVIDVNPENPKYPIVEVSGELRPDGKPRVIETNEYGVRIVRPLTKEEGAAYIKPPDEA